jgi:hypothetical protein
LIKKERQNNETKIIFSTGARTTNHPHTKE